MNRALKLLACLVVGGGLPSAVFAQAVAPVVVKVAPSSAVMMVQGLPRPFTVRDDGLRVYSLPVGTLRVTVTASGFIPKDLTLNVQAGAPRVELKLEPRGGHLLSLGSAATAPQPRHLCFSADGKHLFVALLSGGLDVFAVPSLQKETHLVAPQGPVSAYTDVALVGKVVWAVQDDGRIHLFDSATLAYQSSESVTGGGSSYLTPISDGRVVVVNNDSSQILVVDSTTLQVKDRLSLPGGARDVAVHGNSAWVSLFDKRQVVTLGLSPLQVKQSWTVGTAPRPVGVLGNVVLVADMATGLVHFIDANGKDLRTVDLPANPHEMAQDPRHPWVAVASRGRNNPTDYRLAGPEFGSVTILDARGLVMAQVWGRDQPTGLAFSPDGRFFAFTDFLSNDVELYRVRN